jgi:hypothetical protein
VKNGGNHKKPEKKGRKRKQKGPKQGYCERPESKDRTLKKEKAKPEIVGTDKSQLKNEKR